MFYIAKLKDYIRVPPSSFGLDLEEAILKRIKEKYSGYINQEIGIIIEVSKLNNIGEGVIVPGDGASYYQTEFEMLTFKPELHETIVGRIKDIADFGAFITLGPIEGMIHISQTMDDFVSFSKDKTLLGKESKRSLKISDKCRTRIIAVSFKDVTNPKIGLTMRQKGLGKIEWIKEDLDEGSPKPEKAQKKKAKK